MRFLNFTTAMWLLVLLASPQPSSAQTSPWEGDWITDVGEMNLVVDGNELSGDLGLKGYVHGSVDGNKATITYKVDEENSKEKESKASLELNEDGESFKRSGKGKRFEAGN